MSFDSSEMFVFNIVNKELYIEGKIPVLASIPGLVYNFSNDIFCIVGCILYLKIVIDLLYNIEEIVEKEILEWKILKYNKISE